MQKWPASTALALVAAAPGFDPVRACARTIAGQGPVEVFVPAD